METLCSPYVASPGLSHKCFSLLYLVAVPELLWLCVFAAETCFRPCKVAGRVPGGLLLLLCLVIMGYFTLLSIELFYLDLEAVSPVEVLAYLSPALQWTFVMYLYQRSYHPQNWGFTAYVSLQTYYLVHFAGVMLQFLLWVGSAGKAQSLQSGEVRLEPSLQTWTQLLPWAFHALLMGYLVSGWVERRVAGAFFPLQEVGTWYDQVSIYAKLTIMWIFPVLKLGRQQPLTPEDIGNLRPEEEAASQGRQFRSHLEALLHQPHVKRPILKAVYNRFKFEMGETCIYGTVATTMDYVGSFFILAVSNYLASDEPIWRGYALVGYLMLFKLLQAVCNTQFRFQMLLFSLHLKAALSTQIYEKSLKSTTRTSKASGESSEKASYAQITNLMQVDLERIAMGIPYSLRAAVWPFQISFGIYMMFKTLGSIGSFAALGAMLVLFLVNGVTSKKIGQ